MDDELPDLTVDESVTAEDVAAVVEGARERIAAFSAVPSDDLFYRTYP